MIGLRVIIGYNVVIGLLSLFVIFFDESSNETVSQGIQLLVATFVAYGLFERNEFARKSTVVLYSIALVIDFLKVFVGIPYALFYTDQPASLDYFSVSLLITAFAMSMFTVFYLMNPGVREAYASKNV